MIRKSVQLRRGRAAFGIFLCLFDLLQEISRSRRQVLICFSLRVFGSFPQPAHSVRCDRHFAIDEEHPGRGTRRREPDVARRTFREERAIVHHSELAWGNNLARALECFPAEALVHNDEFRVFVRCDGEGADAIFEA